jgi:hypothetical protein
MLPARQSKSYHRSSDSGIEENQVTAPVQLIAMFCTRCNSPVQAKPDEVAWVCPQCQQGLLVSDEHGVVALDIHYSADIPQGKSGKPYWVAQGQVALERRTFSGNEISAMQSFWQSPHLFFVPASAMPLEQLIQVSTGFLRQPPRLQAGGIAPFQPITLLPADVKPIVEFTILTIEAERKDQLRELVFNLQLGEPELWVLPS